MDAKERKQYLASILSKDEIIKYRMTLLIGEATKVFKSIFTGNIITITTAEEVKDFIDNYSKESEEVLVFEDVSLMNDLVQSYLLKYFERDYRPLVVLASGDNLSPVLLSRFNRIIKLPTESVIDFVSLKAFMEEHSQDLKSNYILPELKDASLRYCPEYYYNYKKLAIAKHENKNRNQLMKFL